MLAKNCFCDFCCLLISRYEALKMIDSVEDSATGFAEGDYKIHHELAKASGNSVYVLTLNGLRGLYSRIARFYFSKTEARILSADFYRELIDYATTGKHDESIVAVRRHGIASGKIWQEIRDEMPKDLVD